MMRARNALNLPLLLGALAIVLGAAAGMAQVPQTFRIATYNIQFLDASNSDERFAAVKAVIDAVDAHVFALQEIDDREALEKVFDPAVWQLVIDDQSGDDQDLAVAVRAPLRVVGDLDADDDDFLFPHEESFFFPNRRDVLDVRVKVPGVDDPVHVLVVHLKSRFGGRASTNPRRVGAAVKLVDALEHDFEDVPFILLGDFNDNPDDQSINILESGDTSAEIEIENEPDLFLINLTEPLAAQGKVTNSLFAMAIDPVSGAVVNVDFDSRNRNFDQHNTNTHTGNILFDQILIPRWMADYYVADSAAVFNGPENVGASDHLPVSADFRVEGSVLEPEVNGVVVTGLLPNPVGRDAGSETVTLRNFGSVTVNLDGWRIMDRSEHTLELNGTLAAGAMRTITIPVDGQGRSVLPLTNSGDEIRLLDSTGAQVDSLLYTEVEATAGNQISRGPDG